MDFSIFCRNYCFVILISGWSLVFQEEEVVVSIAPADNRSFISVFVSCLLLEPTTFQRVYVNPL